MRKHTTYEIESMSEIFGSRWQRVTAAIVLCAVVGISGAFSVVHGEDDHTLNLDKAEKQVVKISELGCEPKVMHLKQIDGSVFFVNTSKDSLITLDIDFKDKRVHCASGNMVLGEDGHLRSKSPIVPRDFAVTCFPEHGEYDVKVLGLKVKGAPLETKVIVE